MSEQKRGTITVNGQTWVAPEQPEPKDGETGFTMKGMMLGQHCPRCGKFIHGWSSAEGDEPLKAPVLPEHPNQECDHTLVDAVHDL